MRQEVLGRGCVTTVDVGKRGGGRGKQSCVWADRVALQISNTGQVILLSRRHVVFLLSLDARPYTRSSRFSSKEEELRDTSDRNRVSNGRREKAIF